MFTHTDEVISELTYDMKICVERVAEILDIEINVIDSDPLRDQYQYQVEDSGVTVFTMWATFPEFLIVLGNYLAAQKS